MTRLTFVLLLAAAPVFADNGPPVPAAEPPEPLVERETNAVAQAEGSEPTVGPGQPVPEQPSALTDTNDLAKTDLAQAGPESVEGQLGEAAELQAAVPPWSPHRKALQIFNQANDWLDEKIGLRLGLAYTSLFLWASDAPFGDESGAAGDFDFYGRWKAWGRKSGNTGTFAFNIRHRHGYTATAPSGLDESTGSAWPLTSGFSDAGFELTQLYLDQEFLERRVIFRLGQIFQDNHFDSYTYKSQKLFFLNAAFSDNPAVAFPEASIGFASLIRPLPGWSLLTGVGDAEGRKLGDPSSDKLFSGAELGWRPANGVMKDHGFAVLGWFTPAKAAADADDGRGLAFTYEWLPEEHEVGAFLRYSWSLSTATAVRHLASGGIVWDAPFGREQDRLGFAVAWGEPNAQETVPPAGGPPVTTNGGSQTVVEVFHRFQLTPYLQVTPDFQILINPSFNRDADVIAVLGIRARFAL